MGDAQSDAALGACARRHARAGPPVAARSGGGLPLRRLRARGCARRADLRARARSARRPGSVALSRVRDRLPRAHGRHVLCGSVRRLDAPRGAHRRAALDARVRARRSRRCRARVDATFEPAAGPRVAHPPAHRGRRRSGAAPARGDRCRRPRRATPCVVDQQCRPLRRLHARPWRRMPRCRSSGRSSPTTSSSPATALPHEELARLVERKLLTVEPYRSYGIDLDDVLQRGRRAHPRGSHQPLRPRVRAGTATTRCSAGSAARQ